MDDTRGPAGRGGVASVAALIGDGARARMLLGLMDGRALTATELARLAGVTKPTASSHLAKLLGARLVAVERQGRHRYFRLRSHQVAEALEKLQALAPSGGAAAVQPGPADLAMRTARACYDHLAGEYGVLVFESLLRRQLLVQRGKGLDVSPRGERFAADLGIDVPALRRSRRPLCLACLDWSERRHHLAGALGAALLGRILALGWARRSRGSRAIVFSALGERALRARFPVAAGRAIQL